MFFGKIVKIDIFCNIFCYVLVNNQGYNPLMEVEIDSKMMFYVRGYFAGYSPNKNAQLGILRRAQLKRTHYLETLF